MDNSNDSFTDPMEREAIETLLSISKAPSPQRIETVMDRIPSSTDPCCLPGDPPPMLGPQVAAEEQLTNYGYTRMEDFRSEQSQSQNGTGSQKSGPVQSKLAQV